MENKSWYDPDRKTVGAIYRDAALACKEGATVENGDLTRELQKSLVDDINDCINSLPFGKKPFYITVHEKKDLQMPRAILRRLITTRYRPYPEDDTIVFYVEPETNIVEFCWCLPHWSEMDNMLANESLFESEMIQQIKAWKDFNLWKFGFCKGDMGQWIANPNYKDKKMEATKQKIVKTNLFLPIGF